MISLGIDIGGTGCKCVAFRDTGEQIAMSYREYPTKPGEVNLNALALRESVFFVISDCVKKLDDAKQVAAITVSSFGESFVPVDRGGQPLSDIILYFANTESGEFSRLIESVGVEKFMRITCVLPDASYSLAKMLYTLRTAPRPVWKFLFIASYICFCLSGETVADYSLACRSILFDVRKLCWSDELTSACGIDPEKSTIFIQSMVPELTELTFYYMNLVTVSRVQRNPTVKAEIQMRNFEASIPVGFFTYPISQAADITAFRATTVPVGEDQMPMIEQTQEIVHKFNTVYGEALVQPKIMLPENDSCRRLPGIDGKAKMSKSLGNCIYLSEEPDEIKKKVMSMYTDPDHIKITDPGKIEGNTVFTYLDAFCQPEHFERYLPDYANLDELKEHYQRGGLGDVKVKKFLNNVLQETLEPIRNRRKELEKDIPAIYEMLKKSSEEAEKVAAQTLADVKAAMKINYFDDLDLIRSQAERYGK